MIVLIQLLFIKIIIKQLFIIYEDNYLGKMFV